MKIKYQTVETIRSVDESGLDDHKFQFDASYNRVVGVRGYLLVNGGLPYIEVGLKDREETIHNLSPNEDWKPDTGEFYKPLNIENKGQDFYLQTKLPAAIAGADLVFQAVFVLQKDNG